MLLLSTLLLSAVGGVFADNATEAEPYSAKWYWKRVDYDEWIPIPANDFVGFGYDIRYEDPMQGLRLPLLNYTYDERRSFYHPLFREYKYKVPDQLFVRMVATADADNYAFETIDEVQDVYSAGVGIKFEKTKFEQTGRPVPAGGAGGGGGSSAEGESEGPSGFDEPVVEGGDPDYQPSGGDRSLQELGYPAASGNLLPQQSAKVGTNVLSIGVEFNFLKSTLEKRESIVNKHRQLHQLFQVLVDQRTLRESLQRDIDILSGRSFEEEPFVFQSFMEKYGTHYVKSAMVGGKIEMTSVVHKFVKQDNLNVNFSVDILSNTTEVIADVSNQTESIIVDSSNCTGDFDGYDWNTYLERCEYPYRISCTIEEVAVVPDPDMIGQNLTLREGFEYDPVDFAVQIYDEGSVWRFGPRTVPVNLTGQDCTGLTTNSDGTGTEACWYVASPKQPSNMTIVDKAMQQASLGPAPPSDCPEPCNYLKMDGRTQTYNRIQRGVYRHWPQPLKPQVMTMKVFTLAGVDGMMTGNIDFYWEGDQPTPDPRIDDKPIFKFAQEGRLNNSYGNVGLFHDDGHRPYWRTVAYPTGQWVEYRFEFDWVAHTITVWQDASTVVSFGSTDPVESGLRRIINKAPMINDTPGIQRIDVYNCNANTTVTYLTDIRICRLDGQPSSHKKLTKESSVQKSTSTFKQLITGNIDFEFEKKNLNFEYDESFSYRICGGDVSHLDLLTLSAKKKTFDDWKETLPSNPVTVRFAVKPMAFLFSDTIDEETGVNPREEIMKAIKAFTTIKEVGAIEYDTAPMELRSDMFLRRKGIAQAEA